MTVEMRKNVGYGKEIEAGKDDGALNFFSSMLSSESNTTFWLVFSVFFYRILFYILLSKGKRTW